MRKDYYSNSKDYINRWVVSYADLVTMLLALFMVMFAVSANLSKDKVQTKEKNMSQISQNVKHQTKETDNLEKLIKDNVTKSDEIKILREPQGVVIRLNNNVLFDQGSAIIKEDAQKTLDKVVNILSKIENPCIIEGHTDSTPISNAKYPSNWELSTARATNIISYMMKTGKIPPKRLSAVGYGEYMPISDNTSSGGRMLNRRVDIIILEKK